MSNFHARDSEGGNFETKKALREAVARGEVVLFTDTSGFNNRGTLIGASGLRDGDCIVGPDPYHARNWYASIKNGKVV
jgi:hypothetical protein